MNSKSGKNGNSDKSASGAFNALKIDGSYMNEGPVDDDDESQKMRGNDDDE